MRTLYRDSVDKTRTYKDGSANGKRPLSFDPRHKETPVPQGETGVLDSGGRYWTRTSDPYNVSVVRYQLRQATSLRVHILKKAGHQRKRIFYFFANGLSETSQLSPDDSGL